MSGPKKQQGDTGVIVEKETKTKSKLKRPKLYKVLLHNDDYTTMEFVVAILITIFNKSESEATAIMLHIHLDIPDGVSLRLLSPVVGVTSLEWNEPRPFTIAEITAPGPRHYQADDVLAGSFNESTGRFRVGLQPEGISETRRFEVGLPAMSINGEIFQAEPVTFEMYREWGAYTCAQ